MLETMDVSALDICQKYMGMPSMDQMVGSIERFAATANYDE